MKIALITGMKFGLTQFIHRDVSALSEKGHRVRLFALRTRPGLYNPDPDWQVIPASPVQGVVALIRLILSRPRVGLTLVAHALRFGAMADLAIAAQFSPAMLGDDLIFSYFGDHKLFVGYYCKRITGLPLTVTIRAYELYRNPNPRMFVESLAGCDRVLTITEFNRAQLVDRFGVPPSRIDIVRQIVDLDAHKPRSVVKILIVGFFAEKKGHETLFKAFSMLDRPNVELWVVGDETPTVLAFDVRGLASELGIEDRVAFFGAQKGPALRALFRECDIFCLPSRTDRKGDKEGFPNVIAEAMAFGKPVVSTRHAGIPEAIDGMLVDENAVEALAAALRELVDDPDLRSSMGSENRDRAVDMFSPQNNDRLEEVLTRIVAQQGP